MSNLFSFLILFQKTAVFVYLITSVKQNVNLNLSLSLSLPSVSLCGPVKRYLYEVHPLHSHLFHSQQDISHWINDATRRIIAWCLPVLSPDARNRILFAPIQQQQA